MVADLTGGTGSSQALKVRAPRIDRVSQVMPDVQRHVHNNLLALKPSYELRTPNKLTQDLGVSAQAASKTEMGSKAGIMANSLELNTSVTDDRLNGNKAYALEAEGRDVNGDGIVDEHDIEAEQRELGLEV